MPSDEDIIEFLRRTKANNPEQFDQYIEYYKTKYPDFYKNKLAPIFEEKPVGKPKEEIVNPIDEFNEEVKPLGSANVGEELPVEEEKPKSETTTEPSISTTEPIKREKNMKKVVLIVVGALVAIGLIVAGTIYLIK